MFTPSHTCVAPSGRARAGPTSSLLRGGLPLAGLVYRPCFELLRKPGLLASLGLSALLTAAALRLPDQDWLCWISFLPLFFAIRTLRPLATVLAGGLWGACLYLFCTADLMPAPHCVAVEFAGGTLFLVLLLVVPAIYVGLAARPRFPAGVRLLILALGWTLVVVIATIHRRPGSPGGPAAGSGSDPFHVFRVTHLLGCLSAAFLVAAANDLVAGILNRACLESLFAIALCGGSSIDPTRPAARAARPPGTPIRRCAAPRAPPLRFRSRTLCQLH